MFLDKHMPPSGFKEEYIVHLLGFIKGLYGHLLQEAADRSEDPKDTLDREIVNIGKYLSKFKLEE